MVAWCDSYGLVMLFLRCQLLFYEIRILFILTSKSIVYVFVSLEIVSAASYLSNHFSEYFVCYPKKFFFNVYVLYSRLCFSNRIPYRYFVRSLRSCVYILFYGVIYYFSRFSRSSGYNGWMELVIVFLSSASCYESLISVDIGAHNYFVVWIRLISDVFFPIGVSFEVRHLIAEISRRMFYFAYVWDTHWRLIVSLALCIVSTYGIDA